MAALLLADPVMAVPDRRAFIVERADGTNDSMTFRELWNEAKAFRLRALDWKKETAPS